MIIFKFSLRLKVLKQVSNDAKGGKSPTLGCGVVTGHCCFDAGSSPWSPLHSLRPVWVAYFSFPLCVFSLAIHICLTIKIL